MCRQLANPFIQSPDILHHLVDLGLDQASRLMHAGIAKDGAYSVKQ